MTLWRLTPAARAEDPRWLNRPRFDDVLVRAPSAGEARRLAAESESPAAAPAVGNETHGGAPALGDPKLYALSPVAAADADANGFSAEGPAEVLRRRRASLRSRSPG